MAEDAMNSLRLKSENQLTDVLLFSLYPVKHIYLQTRMLPVKLGAVNKPSKSSIFLNCNRHDTTYPCSKNSRVPEISLFAAIFVMSMTKTLQFERYPVRLFVKLRKEGMRNCVHAHKHIQAPHTTIRKSPPIHRLHVTIFCWCSTVMFTKFEHNHTRWNSSSHGSPENLRISRTIDQKKDAVVLRCLVAYTSNYANFISKYRSGNYRTEETLVFHPNCPPGCQRTRMLAKQNAYQSATRQLLTI